MRTNAMMLMLILTFVMTGCRDQEKPGTPKEETVKTQEGEEITLKYEFGVDAKAKKITIGALNDESGPAAALGKPWAIGKRVLVKSIAAGDTTFLPEGWTVELIERDHAYNPQQSVQAYKEIKDDILFLATSFGTPNTLPLVPLITADGILAYPASLSSAMAANRNTPPAGPSYELEARRAMDWVVSTADAASIKAAIVYQQDDYGKDGLEGWKKAAADHGVAIVSEQTVAPGQKDMAAVITALKNAGATHVLLTTLPSATGPILGTAAQLKYMPTWIGNTPSWIDAFFKPEVIPSAVFANFHWVSGLPYWGEDLPGMDRFVAAFEAHKPEGATPDFYTMMSYVQGLIALEAANRAIESDDISRGGYQDALGGISGFTAGGLTQPLSYDSLPFVTGTKTRVLKPDFEKSSWSMVAPYAAAGGNSDGLEKPEDREEPVEADEAKAGEGEAAPEGAEGEAGSEAAPEGGSEGEAAGAASKG